MYNLERKHIVSWLVASYGYNWHDFAYTSLGELSRKYLLTDKDVRACAEFNGIKEQ